MAYEVTSGHSRGFVAASGGGRVVRPAWDASIPLRARARLQPSPARAARRCAMLLMALICWSMSYLLRQPGPGLAVATSPLGDFALEGMLLAAAWLVAIMLGSVSCLGGAVVVRAREGER